MRGSDPLGRLLTTLSRRARILALVRWIFLGAVLSSAAALARVLLEALLGPGPLADSLLTLSLVAAAVAAVLLALPTCTRLSAMSAARVADHRAELADELSTAVWLQRRGGATPMERVQIERAQATAAGMHAHRILPIGAAGLRGPVLLLLSLGAAGLIVHSLQKTSLLQPSRMPERPQSHAGRADRTAVHETARGSGRIEAVHDAAVQTDDVFRVDAPDVATSVARAAESSGAGLSGIASGDASALAASVKTSGADHADGAGGSGKEASLQAGATAVRRPAPVTLLAAPDAEIATGGARVQLPDLGSFGAHSSAQQDGEVAPPPTGLPDPAAPDTRIEAFRSEGAAAGKPDDPSGVVQAATSRGEGIGSGASTGAGGAARARIGAQEADESHAAAAGIALRARLQSMQIPGRVRRGAAGPAEGPLVATAVQSAIVAPLEAPATRAYANAGTSGGGQLPYAYRGTVTRYLLHLNAVRD